MTQSSCIRTHSFQWDHRERIETLDGDFFDVDYKYYNKNGGRQDPWNTEYDIGRPSSSHDENNNNNNDNNNDNNNHDESTPLVLICHGLQSSSDSPLVKDMVLAFHSIGMDAACINFRGCGGEPNHRTPFGYHLSFTNDLQYMVERIGMQTPKRPLYLSGFSLGANVVTKFLANVGTEATTRYHIYGAAVNAVPFDLTKVYTNLNLPGFSKTVYGNRLLQSMIDRIEKSSSSSSSSSSSFETCEFPFPKEKLRDCKTIMDMENLVICSVFGFDDAFDYYRKSSTVHILDKVAVPQLIVQALDDPFLNANTNPPNNISLPVCIHYTKHGGHCAYLFQSTNEENHASSWMPMELARFLQHVDQSRRDLAATAGAGAGDGGHEKNENVDLKTFSVSPATIECRRRRRLCAAISHSFPASEFKPAWFARNSHFQTILAVFFRDKAGYFQSHGDVILSLLWNRQPGTLALFDWDVRERVETPDGDFFDVDWKYCFNTQRRDPPLPSPNDDIPLVLICHGLQSNSASPLAKDMAIAYNNIGMDAACMNYRGCSGEINRTPTGYHLGYTDDLKLYIEHINAKFPNKPIYLSGFSLGANIVTKFLADIGDKAEEYNVWGAAVNALPLDVSVTWKNINLPGISKTLYGDRLLQSMIQRVEDSHETINYPFTVEEARSCTSIFDFEDIAIARVFGFKDPHDYYKKSQTIDVLDRVEVPLFVLQALDDPFFLGSSNPKTDPSMPLRIQYTEHGGHCGYIFHSGEILDSRTSWMPTELSRFLKHVHERRLAVLKVGKSLRIDSTINSNATSELLMGTR